MPSDDPTHTLWYALQLAAADIADDLAKAESAVVQADANYTALIDLMDTFTVEAHDHEHGMNSANPDWLAHRVLLIHADRIRSERQDRHRILTDRYEAIRAALKEAGVTYNDVLAFARTAEGRGGSN